VVFCFDGDKAGRKAAWRALEATLPKLKEGLQARFLFLPDGEDPDSMIRQHGEEAFAQQISKAVPLSEFFFDHFTADIDLSSLDGRARLVEQTQPFIETLPEGVFRQMMEEKLESLAQHRLQKQAPAQFQGGQQFGSPGAQQPGMVGKPVQKRTHMRTVMAHLVQNCSFAEKLTGVDELAGLGNDDIQGIEILQELVDFCLHHPNITTAQLIELWYDNPALPVLHKLAIWDLPGEEEEQAQEFVDAFNRIRLAWVETQLSRVTNIMAQKEEYRALQQRRQDLKEQLDS